jgi:hypothetical protein
MVNFIGIAPFCPRFIYKGAKGGGDCDTPKGGAIGRDRGAGLFFEMVVLNVM